MGTEPQSRMSESEAVRRLVDLQYVADAEAAHEAADAVLCEFLSTNDFGEIVDQWKKIKKYYA